MGNNNLKTTNDILVKVDHNNLIYIDPNSVLVDGAVEPRAVEPENLVMYVNLEADLIPRSTLIADGAKSTLVSVAEGTLNFMKNSNGADYDTQWTDSFVDKKSTVTGFQTVGFGMGAVNIPIVDKFTQNDASSQSFGIENISIKVMGANFIPRVDIKFIDVRGKTLFESPANSPYAAFFHIPWPIFYLTVKGYYGKAIRYRLHMIKFNSKYNSGNGNFEISCNFVGSTYAYLADISIESVLNAPYFYLSESVEDAKYNEKTGQREKTLFKTTKGYRVLRSVYQEYINKGYLTKNFPVRTLREIIVLAGRLSKILEQKIFSKFISHHTLSAIKDYEDTITVLKKNVQLWANKYVSGSVITLPEEAGSTKWSVITQSDKSSTVPISQLENIINKSVTKMESNEAFGSNAPKKDDKIVTNTISCAELKNINSYYRTITEISGVVNVINIEKLLDQIDVIARNYNEQRNKVEVEVEKIMNETIENDLDIGIGFKPSVRNIIAILLANAETYIRLMKDVHEKAFEQAAERKRIFEENIVKTSGILRDGGNMIFPWPEVKETTQKGKEIVLVYPGSREMEKKLRSNDKVLWPEVDFVENFYAIALKIKDNLESKEGSVDNFQYVFGDSVNDTKKDISVLTNMMNYIPYTDKSMSSILYEIYERSKYTTSLSPFDTDSIRELAEIEYSNLKNQVASDIDVVDSLKRNATSYSELISHMESIMTKYPYYLDQIPTTDYIADGLEHDFSISKYKQLTSTTGSVNDYLKLSKFLKEYKPEEYRKEIYPFNTSTYLSSLSSTSAAANNSQLNGMLKVNPPNDFISSPLDPKMWTKDGFTSNMFTNTIKINGIDKHMLNTPYFHKQLYNDFIKTQSLEKYVGSSYLLLNSLPYKDLDDVITSAGSNTLISTIFREIGATHYIPYHLMIKWGSIYHRYKKYINEGIDIIEGVTEHIDGSLFFDNNKGLTFITIPDWIHPGTIKTVNRLDQSDIGFHPYYETIFHQIANGYGFLNIDSQVDSYSESLSSGLVRLRNGLAYGLNTWTSLIDQSKFDINDQRYVLLPTNGNSMSYGNDFTLSEQENFRILWGIGTNYIDNVDYTEYTFPTYKEYLKTTTNEFSLSTNYKKVIDLVAAFKPEILEAFELAFLDFSSERLNESKTYKPYEAAYTKFQDFLMAIVSVKKDDSEPTNDFGSIEFFNMIRDKQGAELMNISTTLQSNDNMIRLTMSNPRETNDYVFGGFTKTDVEHFSIDPYNPDQLIENIGNIELYLGEDMDGYYRDFFSVNDVALNEENIKQFRPLIYMYAGQRYKGDNPTKSDFVNYLKSTIINPSTNEGSKVKSPENRLIEFINHITHKIRNDLKAEIETQQVSGIYRGWNDDPTVKLELYNYFKSFNDKWTAGNSIGQRSLIEEFLFLDRANRDIGDEVYLSLDKLLRLGLKENANITLYGAISLLVQDSGFDIRALPAYVNFYGTNVSNASKIIPSKDVARNMFGSFLDVDYQESSPKIILQYVGPSSQHPDMKDISKKKYLFNDDGFDIGDVNNNPVIVSPNIFASTDFTKSNKVVAFEVSFGDQNQSIFKTVELDQSTIRNTAESFIVLENLGKSEGGDSVAQVDIGLWNIYRQASYQCGVTCMGNVMIQPTMYFYLKNVPLFKGSYWITEVTHDIKSTGIETSFKGSRIPQRALPILSDTFIKAYRPLFDKVVKDAIHKVKEENKAAQTPTTEQTVVTNSGSYSTDTGGKRFQTEEKINKQSSEPYCISYNGFDNEPNIEKVKYKGIEWLRAKVIEMGTSKYPIPDNRTMGIISRTRLAPDIKWGDIRKLELTSDFYETKFNANRLPDGNANIFTDKYTTTEFLNPNNGNYLRVTTVVNHYFKAYQGPVSIGPEIDGYGIGMSKSLMRKLKLSDGEIVFFKLT